MELVKSMSLAIAAILIASPLAFTAANATRTIDAVQPDAGSKSDRVIAATTQFTTCSASGPVDQAPSCLTWTADVATAEKPARFITLERRDEANATSTLMRVPVMQAALR